MSSPNVSKDPRKIAIVTGGSRGLGRNTVFSLARRGVDSVFAYNSNRADADKVVAEVERSAQRRLPCNSMPAR